MSHSLFMGGQKDSLFAMKIMYRTVRDDSGGIDISDVSKEVFNYESGTGEVEIERVKGKITTRQ